jgi:virginiamycin B lyase
VPYIFSVPTQIVDGPAGDIWFNESFGKIGRITPQGKFTEILLPAPSGGQYPTLSAMTAGPDGNLWAIDSANDTIDRIGKDGQVTTFPIHSGQTSDNFGSIVSGADGNLWFTTGFSNRLAGWSTTGLPSNATVPGTIDRITPQGVLTQFVLPLGDGYASSLAVGRDGVWFTDPVAGRVGKIDYSGHAIDYTGPAPYYDLASSPLTVGPDGNAYYSAQSGPSSFIIKVTPGGKLTPIAISGSVSSSTELLSGSDGVYFIVDSSDNQSGTLDRLSPDGTLSTILTNPALESGMGFAFDPNGNLWIPQGLAGQIDRLDLSATHEPEPGPTLVAGLPGPVQMGSGVGPFLPMPVGEPSSVSLADVRSSAGVKVTSATIDWGDGSTPTVGTLSPGITVPSVDSVFPDHQVSASHAYAKAGSYTVTVTINGTGPTGKAMTTSVVETATAVDPTASPQPPLVIQAGKSIAYQGPLAIFSTPTPHDASGSDFTATVDWGDGSKPTAGTVVGGNEQPTTPETPPTFNPNPTWGPLGLFEVSGDHTYATTGTFQVKVTLTDKFGHSSSESTSIQVSSGSLAINPMSPIQVTANPTPKSSGPNQGSIYLGTLTSNTGSLAGQNDSVTIDWGDGSTPTAGTLSTTSYVDTTPVADDIMGTHAYVQPGTYTVKITVHDDQKHSTEATTTIQVSARQFAVQVDPLSSPTGTAGAPMPIQTLAAIVTPGSADLPSDFTATVDWGDGSTPTACTVAPVAGTGLIYSPDARLQVSGSHTYSEPGLYQLTVTAHGSDGSTAHAITTVQVSLATATIMTPAIPSSPSFTAGKVSAPTVLGSFSSFNGGTAANFKATVDWGDGSPIQSATIQPYGPSMSGIGQFNILGTHDYTMGGSYIETLTIIGADGLPMVITTQATAATPTTVKVTPATPVVSPSGPSVVTGPIAPTILPRHFQDFKPTILKHPRPAPHHKIAHPKVVRPASQDAEPSTKRAKDKAVHHVAKNPAHAAATRKHPAGSARHVQHFH